MSLPAWVVLGGLAGYLAGSLVKRDDGSAAGHIVIGIAGAIVGGLAASVVLGIHPIDDPFDAETVVVSVIAAIVSATVGATLAGRTREGRGSL